MPVDQKKVLDQTGLARFKAKQDAFNEAKFVALSAKGAANGIATLDANTLVPTSQLPIGSSSDFGTLKAGSNISCANGVLSLTSTNITDALGYTPADADGSLNVVAITNEEIDSLFE